MKKIFILGDGAGWIVDRIVEEMVIQLENRFDFILDYYGRMTTENLIKTANQVDLTHYGNFDFSRHLGFENSIKKPFLFSIRSFRYPEYVIGLSKRFETHVVNLKLKSIFPNAWYISDGIFPHFKPDHPFTVGMAFYPGGEEYKGYHLAKEACDSLGIELKVAHNLTPCQMVDFYKSVDLMLILSEAEGFNTIAMECMSMNKPFITTAVGAPETMNCHKVERNVEAIKKEIEKFYTFPQVESYSWNLICNQFSALYERLIYGKF